MPPAYRQHGLSRRQRRLGDDLVRILDEAVSAAGKKGDLDARARTAATTFTSALRSTSDQAVKKASDDLEATGLLESAFKSVLLASQK